MSQQQQQQQQQQPAAVTAGGGDPQDQKRIVPGHRLLTLLQEALGLEGRAIQHLVISIKMNDVVKMYVEELVGPDKIANLVGELPDVALPPMWVGRVEVEPSVGVQGGGLQLRQLATRDTPARLRCLKLLELLSQGDEETRLKIDELLFGGSKRRQQQQQQQQE